MKGEGSGTADTADHNAMVSITSLNNRSAIIRWLLTLSSKVRALMAHLWRKILVEKRRVPVFTNWPTIQWFVGLVLSETGFNLFIAYDFYTFAYKE